MVCAFESGPAPHLSRTGHPREPASRERTRPPVTRKRPNLPQNTCLIFSPGVSECRGVFALLTMTSVSS